MTYRSQRAGERLSEEEPCSTASIGLHILQRPPEKDTGDMLALPRVFATLRRALVAASMLSDYRYKVIRTLVHAKTRRLHAGCATSILHGRSRKIGVGTKVKRDSLGL